jgi:ATP-dependent DNA helicase RecG
MTSEARKALEAILAGATAHDLESETLEFKEATSNEDQTIKRIVDAVLCFANGPGGTVVLGVANKVPGPPALGGAKVSADLIRQRVYALTEPPLVVDVVADDFEEKTLLFIRVPQSPEIHADQQGRAPRRIGTDCIPMSPSGQARLREERQGIDWSAVTSGRSVTETASAALEAARDRLATFTDKRRELASLSKRDLLRALNVVASDGKLTRAGEILFCEVQAGVGPRLVYQYRATPGGEPSAIERLDSSLVVDFERVLELVSVRRHLTPVTLPDGQQIHIDDFPELAVREAAANAVIHRDYHVTGPVMIEHSPAVFVVTSPGPLVSGVTPQNILTHPSKPRNHLLARVARVLGLAEEVGRGVDRMYREMIRSGREVPTIESSADHVRVTLVGGAPNTQIARYVAELPASERDDTDTMLVLFSLVSQKTVNAKNLVAVLQKNDDECEAVLRRLSGEDAAMLEPTRESARRSHPNYRLRSEALQSLGSAVGYQRRTTDEIDRKVIEHVREYGKVTNRTVRNLLDVSVQRSSEILGDLVTRDVLHKTSEAKRGPSVEYGPGRSFPKKRASRRAPSDEAQLTIE